MMTKGCIYTIRLAKKEFDWLAGHGGSTLLKTLVLKVYSRYKWNLLTAKELASIMDLESADLDTRISVRLTLPLREFVDSHGGAKFIRGILLDFIEYNRSKNNN